MRGNSRAEREDGAAQIKRIARVGVRAGDGQGLLLVKIASGVSAQPQTQRADQRANCNVARRGPREPQNGDGQRISQADTPTGKECGAVAHVRGPISWWIAAITSGTEIFRMAGSVSSIRLGSPTAESARKKKVRGS